MTQDEIMKMAHKAGLHIATDVNWMPIVGLEYAERFAKLVAEHEREAYAKVVSDKNVNDIRNQVLEEVAHEFDCMRIAFGDTAASFAQYVREMKYAKTKAP